TSSQTLCINTAITDISYNISNATGASATGLPAGVTGTFNAGVFTISGTPTASGTFNFNVNVTGACASSAANGSITVNPDASIVLTSAAATTSQTACINTALTDITYTIAGGG